MKKPGPHATPDELERYKTFLKDKAEKNRAYRERRTNREKQAEQEARMLKANRDIDPTREEWLMRAAKAILAVMKERGYEPTGPVKVALGFPIGGFNEKNKTLGACFHASASEGGYREIFIHPELTDTRQILGILTHEICHACLYEGAGHREPFRRACKAVGFEFKEAKYAVDGSEWWSWAYRIADELGPIPHRKLVGKVEGGSKKQKSRMLPLECPCCKIKVRTARSSLEAIYDTSGSWWARCISPSCEGRIDFEALLSELDEGEEEE